MNSGERIYMDIHIANMRFLVRNEGIEREKETERERKFTYETLKKQTCIPRKEGGLSNLISTLN